MSSGLALVGILHSAAGIFRDLIGDLHLRPGVAQLGPRVIELSAELDAGGIGDGRRGFGTLRALSGVACDGSGMDALGFGSLGSSDCASHVGLGHVAGGVGIPRQCLRIFDACTDPLSLHPHTGQLVLALGKASTKLGRLLGRCIGSEVGERGSFSGILCQCLRV
ncbi:MAG: hypothetical protein GY873_35965 [Bosea sp.]|uniref:hypothetical protein n=1 Tax=Bosea sp. (in: a-proteobacteria) TaxID=1871050 RepID=UPI0023998B3A|nr:hypothetical protein [Bosea sp. (in: a-proteobacteria)]